MRSRAKRKSGHWIPRSKEHFPFEFKVKYDILEERKLYDDWEDYRDGMREAPWFMKYGNKPLFKKNMKRLIPYLREHSNNLDSILNSMKKWTKKNKIRKEGKLKRKLR